MLSLFQLKRLLTLVIILLAFAVKAFEQPQSDTLIKKSGNKVEIKVIFGNGQIKEIIHLKNNLKHGPQLKYSSAGVLLSKSNYRNGLLCGKFIEYNNKGEVITYKSYLCNIEKNSSVLHGKYVEYEGNTLITIGYYKKGLKDGKWLQYHRNGIIKSEQHFINDNPVGEQKFYNHKGEISYKSNMIEITQNGKKSTVKHGAFVAYHQSGNISEEGHYSYDKKSGLWKEYNPNGALQREIFYKNGKVHGTNNQYSNSGKPSMKSEFYEEIEIEGKLLKNVFNGTKENYNSSGSLERRETYRFGKKEGIWETYYGNGNLRERNTYQNNLQTGTAIALDEAGNKIYEAAYEIIKKDTIAFSVKTGNEYRWQNKVLVFETNYSNGKENSIRKSYYPSGKLAQTQQVADDVLKGESIEYYENGNIKSKKNYLTIISPSKEKLVKTTGWVLNMTEDGKVSNKTFYDETGNRTVQYSYHNGKLNQLYIDKVIEINYFPNGRVMSEKLISNYSLMSFSRYYYMNGNIRKIGFQNADNLMYNTLHYKSDGSYNFASSSFYNKPDTLLPSGYVIGEYSAGAGGPYVQHKLYTDSIKNGRYQIPFKHGKTFAIMNFINELPHGEFVFFSPVSGDTMLYAKFNNGLLNGPWVEKFGARQVWLRGAYCNQKMCGTWTRNQTSGKAYEIRRYNSETGQSAAITEFYPNGILKSFSDYDSGAYEYRDDKGNLTSRGVIIDEQSKTIQNETYYIGKNILKSRTTYVDKIQNGPAETFYESGKLQSIMLYRNGKRNGIYKEYDQYGKLKRQSNWEDDKLEGMCLVVSENGKTDTLYYRNNNLQVKPPSYSCACLDTTHSLNRGGFAPMLNHLLEYDKLETYMPKYLIPVDSLNYRSIFYTGLQNSHSSNSGFSSMNLMMFKEFAFYLPSNQQLKLSFNPCTTQGYVSRMEISASYGIGNRNNTHVDFYPKRIALEFIKGPVKSADKNNTRFKAFFDTKFVSYSTENKITIKTINPQNNCFTPAVINNLLEVNARKGNAYIFERFSSDLLEQYQLKLSDDELDLFFGVALTDALVKFNYYGPNGFETIEANSNLMLLGGEYACGVIKINCSKGANEVYTTADLNHQFIIPEIKSALQNNGFTRVNFTYNMAEKQLYFTFFTK